MPKDTKESMKKASEILEKISKTKLKTLDLPTLKWNEKEI